MTPQAAKIRTVLFDLDGTLVDNFVALHAAFSHAHTVLGLEPPSYEKVLRTVGGSAPITMGKLMGEKNAEQAMPHFYAYFEAHMFDGLVALAGAHDLLDALHARGVKLAVFTNKVGKSARQMCQHLGLDKRLDAVIGAGDSPWRKPEPEFTRYALEKLQAEAATSALVGDSPFDLKAAQSCNLMAYLVATGSHTIEELSACTPAAHGVYKDLHALGHAVFGLPKA